MRQIISSRFQLYLVSIGAIAIAAAALTLSLLLPWPRRLALAFRYDFLMIFLVFLVLFFLIFQLPTRWQWAAGLCASFLVFGIPLAALWVSGANEPNTVFGLLPWFDARGYYQEASRLLDGLQFSEISTRRPLFPAFFAILLGLTSRNLMASLAILAGLGAFTNWLFAWEIKQRWGSLAGALSLTLVFFFYRRFSGSILTEMLGLPLALTGFTILFKSLDEMKFGRFFLASYLLTLALNARAGAFFTLPMLLLWALWYYWKTENKKSGVSFGLTALAGILAGFLTNYVLFLIIAQPESQPFSNFSYTFYGLAVGGKGWTQVFSDHPEVRSLLENQRSGVVYSLGLKEIWNNPGRMVSGVSSTVGAFFQPSASGVFGFVGRLYDWTDKTDEMIFRLLMMLLSLLSLAAAFWSKKKPVYSLMLFLTVGLLFSVPFAPPSDADHMRAYAASIPLIVSLPAIGLGLLIRRWMKPTELTSGDSSPQDGISAVTGILLAFLATVLPVAAFYLGSKPVVPALDCPPGQVKVSIRLNPDSIVQILPDDDLPRTHLPNLRQSSFEYNLKDFPEWRIAESFRNLTPPVAVYATTDVANEKEVWIIFDEIPQLKTGQVQTFCGRYDREANLGNLYRVQSDAN
ncbi:MAG: hypothetical protein AB9891_11205 [Anaerolineaceae bacterium]